MIKEGKFGPQEGVWLIVITVCTKIFYTSPSMVAALTGTAGWYMTLISASVALLGFTFIYMLLKSFPGKDIIEIFEITLGPFIGFIFSSMLAIAMLYIASIRMREFLEVVKVYILPITPMPLILVLFLISVVILNMLGIETLARLSKLTSYGMVAGFFIVIMLAWQNYNVNNLFPIFGYGIKETLYHGLIRSSTYGEVIIIAVFAPCFQGTKYIKKLGYRGLILSAFFISLALLSFTLTFPYHVGMEIVSPMYEMAALIDYGRFLQRVDPIFLFIMGISSIISASTIFCAFISIYCKMFAMQDTKPVILGGSIIVFSLALFQSSMSDVVFKSVQNIRNYGGLFFYVLPVISLIAAKSRKKGVKENA
jgi:spore germination protein KB